MTALTPLQSRREAVVRAHVEAENNHSVADTVATFHHPRYEVVPFGGATDGAGAVSGLLGALFSAFPDFRADVLRLHHTDSGVVVEVRMTGTQRGEWLGVPPSGRAIDLMSACFFDFDGDRLMCERVYFDNATMMRQLQG